jgi:hypothetical protein
VLSRGREGSGEGLDYTPTMRAPTKAAGDCEHASIEIWGSHTVCHEGVRVRDPFAAELHSVSEGAELAETKYAYRCDRVAVPRFGRHGRIARGVWRWSR